MCGIAGILDFTGRPPTVALIESMTSLLRHRGPDGEGQFRRDGIALGHRRLSIIDVQGGRQPLSNENDQVWLTFNGEIYNFRELRGELQSLGHHFRSDCDSEVIVHAYEQWGDDCVRRFRGMFAFALADFDQRRLLLARDHFGIKPLFYRLRPTYIAFASELTPLLDTEATRPNLNPQSLDYYLRYRYVPAPATIYDQILRLPPACTWSCDFQGDHRALNNFYQLRIEPDESLSDATVVDEFAAVLDESVRAHCVSDVPLGAFLSGGVDSTLIVESMQRQLRKPIQAFSIGFDDEDYSEVQFARQAADQLGAELHTEIVRPDVVAIFRELFARYGEPFADTSAIPTWCVARLAREHVTTVLSGDGADELFAGYTRYAAWLDDRASTFGNLRRQPRKAVQRLWQRICGTQPRRVDRWQQMSIGVFGRSQRRRLWQPEFHRVVDTPCGAFDEAERLADGLADLEFAQVVDMTTYLPGDILMKVDTATMCHGLEARTPFTDLRVVEFARRLPTRWRARVSDHRRELKVLPKSRLQQMFSADFVQRRKQGFAIPEKQWLRRGTPVRRCFDDVVTSHHSLIRDYLDDKAVDELIADFDERGTQATGLWLLFVLGLWLDQRPTANISRAA